MTEYTFISVYTGPNGEKQEIKITTNAVSIPDLLEAVRGFLAANGFYIAPTDSIEVVSQEDIELND